jgi:hypothetical protein
MQIIMGLAAWAIAIFTSGMALSYVGGMVFDHAGTGAPIQLAVNGASFGLLFVIAYSAAWFKAAPWKRKQPSSVERAFSGAE